MFALALKAAKSEVAIGRTHKDYDLDIPSQCLPEKYSLVQVHEQLVSRDGTRSEEDEIQTLLILNSCLNEPTRFVKEKDDAMNAGKISLWISKAILPSGDIIAQDEAPEDTTPASRQKALLKSQAKGKIGLKAIRALHDLYPSSPLADQILLSLLAFTSSHDPWTTSSSLSDSTHMLTSPSQSSHLHSQDFIVQFLLQSFIRPLFSKSKPDTVTAAGRKAMPSSGPQLKYDVSEMDRKSRPWKYDAVYSVTVFGWAIQNVPQETLLRSWHLFIPPLLTLLDDVSTRIRVRGLQLTTLFLPRLTSTLLNQTGLSSVFEDAITPTLLYLPTLTPVEESEQLLPAAYEALFVLRDVLFAPPPQTPNAKENSQSQAVSTGRVKESRKEKEKEKDSSPKFLTRILRTGILPGYTHASTHPSIVTILLTQLQTKLIPKLGIHTVKNISSLLLILSAVLSDPFSSAQSELLMAALKTLQVLILNCWPRMGEEGHRREIVKSLVLCWRGLEEKEVESEVVNEEALRGLKEEVKISGRLLVKAVDGSGVPVNFKQELLPLVRADGSLREVFGIEDANGKETKSKKQ